MDENNNDLFDLALDDLLPPLGPKQMRLEDYISDFEFDLKFFDEDSSSSSVPQSEEENVSFTKSGRKKDKQCGVCLKLFSTNPKLKIHMRVHTRERPYSCSFCPKTFSQQFNHARHEQTHSEHPVKRYQCHQCGLRFNQSCSLKDHFFSHDAALNFECQLCQKRFKQKSNLRTHIYLVHHRKLNPPAFKCAYCEKTFKQRNNLRSHENIHNNVRPYSCRFCPLSFTSAAGLYIHNRSCTGEEIECGKCQKRFKSRESFRKHEILHSGGQLPHKCDICHKFFNSQSNVTRHKRSVHDSKVYSCPVCGEQVTSRSSFRLHQKSHRRRKARNED